MILVERKCARYTPLLSQLNEWNLLNFAVPALGQFVAPVPFHDANICTPVSAFCCSHDKCSKRYMSAACGMRCKSLQRNAMPTFS